VVVTIGQIHGGDNPNVIPEQVELQGTLRTLDAAVRQRTIEHIRQLARGLGETSGTSIDVHFDTSTASVRNDHDITELVWQAASGVVGPEHLDAIPRPSMGSEDFSSYLTHVPGAMFRLGSVSPNRVKTALHTPTFDIDEQAIAIGAKVMARTVVHWSDPDRRPEKISL
jgi:amidohydrolase